MLGGGEMSPPGLLRREQGSGGSHLGRPGMRHGDVARHPLLQQQLSGLHQRFRMEALPHPSAQERVADRDNRHALMMRHIGTDDGAACPSGHTGRRIVDRLVEAVAPARACLGKQLQIGARRGGIDHRGERCRIGGDDDVLAQPALQPQAGHPEIGILVGQLQIARIIGRFRNTPGHVQRLRVFDLPLHAQARGLSEQAAGRRAHDERGHQILEHRAGPGDERRAAGDRRHGAAEPEPVAGRHITLGDGKEARQPGLGR